MNDRRAPPRRLLTILIAVVVCVAVCIAYGVMWWNASDDIPENIPGLRFGYNLDECQEVLAPYCHITIDSPGKIRLMTARSSHWWQRDRYSECTLKFAQVIRPTSTYYILVEKPEWTENRRSEQLKRSIAKVYEQWTSKPFPGSSDNTWQWARPGSQHKDMERPAR